jgi:hypothetical protein
MDFIQKNKSKPLWLDLELREDIDDYATLVFALEKELNIKEVSIHNPSTNELRLLKQTLQKFNSDASIVLSGKITEYTSDKDIHPTLIDDATGWTLVVIPLDEYLISKSIKERVFFCGGSLHTLSKFIECSSDTEFDVYIQGGYAGKDVVGIENVLKKFKKRDEVPTWNLNLDIESTDKVLLSKSITMNFISKNVCHASFVGINDLGKEDTLFNNSLRKYFGDSTRKKCMHDLLAFLTIFNDDVVEFKHVDLVRSFDERPKWHSILNSQSNKSISTNFNYGLFMEMIGCNLEVKNTNTLKNKIINKNTI